MSDPKGPISEDSPTIAYRDDGEDSVSEDSRDVFAPGARLDHYMILRSLGRGGMGEVYLARDTALGRKVAIKVLLPRKLGSKDAVERLMFEARATARFNFPHIVTIHAVGEVRGYPYLAMEYLEGQSLAQRLAEERLASPEAIRIGLAIAQALAEAHRHQILHRDLKPANVMIPRDGRVRVVDFGLAKRTTVETPKPGDRPSQAPSVDSEDTDRMFETATRGVRGTPAYMSPEQWSSDEPTGATDVWALGLVLYEMVAGGHPLQGLDHIQICHRLWSPDPIPPPRGDLPDELSTLIGRCLDKDPAQRPEMDDVVNTLKRLLYGRRDPMKSELSPFRGLLPFDEQHADRFFGRDGETAAFVERLRLEPVLPVIGPSGAGKSSFVMAGVVPRLREQGRWLVLRLRPGTRPFLALATRLLRRGSSRFSTTRVGGHDRSNRGSFSDGSVDGANPDWDVAEGELIGELKASPAGLALRLGELAEAEQSRVLLFVDQLEELYTLFDDEDQRRVFMEALCLAADDPLGPVRVVFTLREDFLGRLAVGPASRTALGRATVLVTPGATALREILERTVDDAGFAFDPPELVDRIIAEVRHEAATLPLLQFAGDTLWQRRDETRHRLLGTAYDEMGGVAGCLAKRAGALLDGLSAGQVRTARSLLLRLVTSEGTRRVMTRGRLLEGLATDATAVLDGLVAGRIVLVRKARQGAEAEAEAELELVHESLIRTWQRLARWIDESREERAFLTQLEQTVELWEKRGRRDAEVWRGEALAEAMDQIQALSTHVPPRIEAFIDAGRRVEEERSAQTRNRWVAVVALVLAAGLSTAWVVILLTRDDSLCAGSEQRLAGIWDDPSRQAMHQAFLGVDRPYAQETWDRLEPMLDHYIDDWSAEYTDACEATHVRGEQSEQVLDLRMTCLDRRLDGFTVLARLLTDELDAVQLDRSVAAAYDLDPLASCTDTEALAAAVPPPDDPRVRDEVNQLRDKLDWARGLEQTGHFTEGAEIARGVVQRADELGYRPLMAEAHFRLGSLQDKTGEYPAAEANLYLAAQAAADAHDDALIAAALVSQVVVVGDRQARTDEGLALHRSAEVALLRSGDDPVLRAQLLHNYGNVQLVQGLYAESQRTYLQAVTLREEVLGADHPDLAATLNNLGLVQGYQGRYEESLATHDRALAIKRRTLGSDHPDLAASLNNIGIVRVNQNQLDEAIEAFEQTRRIYEHAFGPEHADVARTMSNIAYVYEIQEKYEQAIEVQKQALVLRRKTLGERHPEVATSLYNLGLTLGNSGRCPEALPYYEEALDIQRDVMGPDHPEVAFPLTGRGLCQLKLGRPGEAVDPLRHAVRLRTDAGTDPNLLAESQFALARALWASGGDRTEALELVGTARATWAEAGEAHAETAAEATAWLSERGGR